MSDTEFIHIDAGQSMRFVADGVGASLGVSFEWWPRYGSAQGRA